MSCDGTAIRVQRLSKCYHVYDRPQDRLKQALWRGRKQFHREFWALRPVSFEIRRGETVGIIGRNGSGKSTLLQIIAGTLTPTAGTVEVNGRIAALLELGSGFNPDFTGRENVFMNGAILGLDETEIAARFDEIAAFADIGGFIDQPVKTYSSGMYLRLAFAVAVSVDPDILIVDEALSVGDEVFQRKCFARIQTIQQRGTAVLFVSHSAQAVVELCDSALLLDQGELVLAGKPKAVVAQYHQLIYAPENKRAALREAIRQQASTAAPDRHEIAADARQTATPAAPGSSAFYDPALIPKSTLSYDMQGAMIEHPRITLPDGTPVNVLTGGQTYHYCYTVRFSRAAFAVRFGMLIKTTSGLELGGSSSAPRGTGLPHVEANSAVEVCFQFRCLLLPGVYFLNAGCAAIVNGEEQYLHRVVDAAMFRVMARETDSRTGMVDFEIEPLLEVTTTAGPG